METLIAFLALIVLIWRALWYIKNPDVFRDELINAMKIILVLIIIFVIILFIAKLFTN